MKKTISLAVCSVFVATGAASFAQENYPRKPITMIVPTAPGGAGDVIARAINPSFPPPSAR